MVWARLFRSSRLALFLRELFQPSPALSPGAVPPELVAGIRRVKGVPQLGRRVGNWLSAAEGEALLCEPPLKRSGRNAMAPSSRSSLAVDFGDPKSLR